MKNYALKNDLCYALKNNLCDDSVARGLIVKLLIQYAMFSISQAAFDRLTMEEKLMFQEISQPPVPKKHPVLDWLTKHIYPHLNEWQLALMIFWTIDLMIFFVSLLRQIKKG